MFEADAYSKADHCYNLFFYFNACVSLRPGPWISCRYSSARTTTGKSDPFLVLGVSITQDPCALCACFLPPMCIKDQIVLRNSFNIETRVPFSVARKYLWRKQRLMADGRLRIAAANHCRLFR